MKIERLAGLSAVTLIDWESKEINIKISIRVVNQQAECAIGASL